ncbi:MAG: lysophospholipid acyltransferase family protein [Deferrisomatales bacterium]|nr:lysophospholipid acyltransferase family protein [Deferrisomatales bacterium]
MLRLPALFAAGLAGLLLGPLAAAGWRRGAVRLWCRVAAWAVGLRILREGNPPPPGSLVAANHVGYLDILALGATTPGRFLAKAEVAGWPLLGLLARCGGAIFVEREQARASLEALGALEAHQEAGETVVFFPEAGVAPDARTLGPFRPMAFEACVRTGRPTVPVALRYTRPSDPRVWGWIEEPSLWRHLWNRLLPAGPIEVTVHFGAPLYPEPGTDRKVLAGRARQAVLELLGGHGPSDFPPPRGTGGP